MKSSEKKLVTRASLYDFYKSFILFTSPEREELLKNLNETNNLQPELIKVIIEDVKEIDNKIFDLLSKLDSLESLKEV